MIQKSIAILIVLSFLLSSCSSTKNVSETSSSSDSANSSSSSTTTELPSEPTAAPSTNQGTQTDSNNLGFALNLLTGTTELPSVFPSYHIEMMLDTPKSNEDYTAIVNETIRISADVAGKNVHLFQTDPGLTNPKEGYIIGDTDKEYKLVDGSWQEMMGKIALSWAMWQLTVVVPYSYASALYSNQLGTEEVDGRKADVYELDTAKADPATIASMETYGITGMSGKGKVWIDQETGGLLKLELEYTSELQSLDGSTNLGIGSGHISLEVSKVGAVTVTSPL